MSAVSMCAQCGKSSADGVGFSRAAMKRAKGKRKLGETGGCGLRCTGCAQAAQAAEKEAAVQRRAAAAAAGPADTDPNRPRAFFATPGSLYLTEIVVASGGIPCGEPLQCRCSAAAVPWRRRVAHVEIGAYSEPHGDRATRTRCSRFFWGGVVSGTIV